jgi:dTDP-4-dehydrorhamnose reductase
MKNKPIINMLILGANGMLGNAIMRYFSSISTVNITGTVRTSEAANSFPADIRALLKVGIELENIKHLKQLYEKARPDVVVNCVGMVKQNAGSNNYKSSIFLNSLLPHLLSELSARYNSRLVHISTDCVFSGTRGFYSEIDNPDALDLYGRSKLLGEINNSRDITLRISLIGHELVGSKSLLNWFLSQKSDVQGYTKAVFSGLPTSEFARVIDKFILTNPDLTGVYHVATNPISKFDLLRLVADTYGCKNKIIPDGSLVINRSLDSTLFSSITGYTTKPWNVLVQELHQFYQG